MYKNYIIKIMNHLNYIKIEKTTSLIQTKVVFIHFFTN